MISAAAVLGAAGYAHAQTAPREGGWREPPSRPGATQPAPAPAPPAKQPGAAAQQAPGSEAAVQLTERQRQMLGTLHLRDALLVDAGLLAAEKGESPEVKRLGNDLVTSARALDEQLRILVAARGDISSALPLPEEERAPMQQTLQRLRGLSGAEFDREFVLATREVQQKYVEDLKRMRDETPGKNAELKTWLDAAENVAETQLTSTRQVKQALDAQRAAKR
jgi:predicted outer membrane protein